MPSKKTNATRRPLFTQRQRAAALTHQSFSPLIVLTLVLWFLYRSLFVFPVWFDESIGKAIFFGLPVWLYITVSGFRKIMDSFATAKLQPGIFQGLAIGGIFGFITLFVRLLQNGGTLVGVPVFLADRFVWEFILAILTGFWETLFFYSFVMTVTQDLFTKWSLTKQVMFVSTIFMLFHVPNIFLRFNPTMIVTLIALLWLFSIGQALLFARRQNGYTLVLTHAVWGMVLLIYF